MTHLILHKVRGKPAFDIAERMDINGSEAWIIPTSGHAAYPVKVWLMTEVLLIDDVPEVPVEWPDHYASNDKPAAKGTGLKLADFIHIPPPKVKLVRRRI